MVSGLVSSVSSAQGFSDHLVVSCSVSDKNKICKTYALVDTGASGIAFIDERFICHHQLPTSFLEQPRKLQVIDGREISSGDITHTAQLSLRIQSYFENITAYVTHLGHYFVVLGIPWMRRHNVKLDFAANAILFDSPRCIHQCNDDPVPAYVQGISSPLPATHNLEIERVSAAVFHEITKNVDVFVVIFNPVQSPSDPATLVPLVHHQYLSRFQEEVAKKLTRY